MEQGTQTFRGDTVAETFRKIFVHGTLEELDEFKSWLFDESLRLENEKAELSGMEEKFNSERRQFQAEMKALNAKISTEKKSLREEMAFFDKKMDILKNGFAQLDADRRKFEKEKLLFRAKKEASIREASYARLDMVEHLFRGAASPLALKKRYKELLKMFHPDNVSGDHEMVLLINRYYEKMCGHYELSRQA